MALAKYLSDSIQRNLFHLKFDIGDWLWLMQFVDTVLLEEFRLQDPWSKCFLTDVRLK